MARGEVDSAPGVENGDARPARRPATVGFPRPRTRRVPVPTLRRLSATAARRRPFKGSAVDPAHLAPPASSADRSVLARCRPRRGGGRGGEMPRARGRRWAGRVGTVSVRVGGCRGGRSGPWVAPAPRLPAPAWTNQLAGGVVAGRVRPDPSRLREARLVCEGSDHGRALRPPWCAGEGRASGVRRSSGLYWRRRQSRDTPMPWLLTRR